MKSPIEFYSRMTELTDLESALRKPSTGQKLSQLILEREQVVRDETVSHCVKILEEQNMQGAADFLKPMLPRDER